MKWGSLDDVKRTFCEKMIYGLDRLCTETFCPIHEGMLVCQTRGEVGYLESFRAMPTKRSAAWGGASCVDRSACVWSRAKLRVAFRILRKNGPYWNVFCRNVRRSRSKNGCEIPYHCLVTFGLGSEFYHRGFVRMAAYWCSLEVPHGCCVELPPVLTYLMCELCDLESP